MNGENFILYTLEEGGMFQVCRGTAPQWSEAVETGKLIIPAEWRGAGEFDEVEPKFMAWVEVKANHDFVLGMSRERYSYTMTPEALPVGET